MRKRVLVALTIILIVAPLYEYSYFYLFRDGSHLTRIDATLFYAAEDSNNSEAKRALAWGANPNCSDWHSWHPLGLASHNGDDAMVRLLIAHHARTYPECLREAAIERHWPIVALLVYDGADCHNWCAGEALQMAIGAGESKTVQLLRQRGAVLNPKNDGNNE